MSVLRFLPSLLNTTKLGLEMGVQRRAVQGVHGGRWVPGWVPGYPGGEGRWRWREEGWERKEMEQVKRRCEDKLQAMVRENEATVERVKMKHER